MQKEADYLSHWRTITEQSLGWGNSTAWTDHDFENLSDQIFDKTGVRLSISTLKRLWGRVKYESSPNVATLNALAVFAGFDNWREFKQQIVVTANPQVKPGRKKQYLPMALSFVAIIILAALIIAGKNGTKPVAKARNYNYKFSSRKVADGLPNSVVFDYDAGGNPADSVYIQQSWDVNRTEKIPADGKQYTSIYYYPGYFDSKLIVNKKVVKETPVFITTKGWVGTIDHKTAPIYLTHADMYLPGVLGIKANTLAQLSGSPVFNGQLVQFFNVQKFAADGGDFTLETSLRNTSSLQQSSCRKATLYILGTSNAMIIPLADKGCTSDLYVYTSSEWINGKEHDLSAFGCDFSQFQQLRCKIEHKQLTIMLNDKAIMTRPITQTIGDIIGLNIAFEGAGEIKNIKLSNSIKTVYEEKF